MVVKGYGAGPGCVHGDAEPPMDPSVIAGAARHSALVDLDLFGLIAGERRAEIPPHHE